MDIDVLYDSRNLGVTVFRAVLVALVTVAIATLYLSTVSSTSAAYGGASMLLVPILTLIASLVIYIPANRQLKLLGVKTKRIFKHQFSQESLNRKAEKDLLERLEKGLDF